MSWQKRIKHENNTSYSNTSNWNKYTLYCGNIINQLNTIYQQHMDIDITILQKKQMQILFWHHFLKKTRGESCPFPPLAKSLQAYCMCSRQKVEVEMPGVPLKPGGFMVGMGRWRSWVCRFFQTGRIFGVRCFLVGFTRKKTTKLNHLGTWTWGLTKQVHKNEAEATRSHMGVS